MGGPRLTPEQIEAAGKILAETENLSEAARAINVSESTLRTAFARLRTARNRDLHARACERGLRQGRQSLDVAESALVRLLHSEVTDGSGMEPRDIIGAAGTLAKVTAARVALAQREDQRKQAALTRRKTRAEIAAAERADSTGGPVRVVVEYELVDAADRPPALEADPEAG